MSSVYLTTPTPIYLQPRVPMVGAYGLGDLSPQQVGYTPTLGGQSSYMPSYEPPHTHTIALTVGRQVHTTPSMGNSGPTWTDARTTAPTTIDPNVIADVIQKYFGVQLKPIVKPMYKKPYPKWVHKMTP